MLRRGRPLSLVGVQERFWQAYREGLWVADAALVAGVSAAGARNWVWQTGGVAPRPAVPRSARFLSLAEREEIALARAAGGSGGSVRAIARLLGRSASTISRELARNSDASGRYRAVPADRTTVVRMRRPKARRLAGALPWQMELHDWVQAGLTQGWSPQQITARLIVQFPDRPEMRVSHEAIYQALYLQGRGGLRRELTACLRSGRAIRRPVRNTQLQAQGQTRIHGMVMISERPAEVADRAVPGHWEGDLIIGKDGHSAIGTLVERASRFCLLLHLPGDRTASTVRDALIVAINELPAALRRSLTWDQGIELARHAEITLATDLDIYFCDPHSPWQRGTNENTNGLLRQYFPKGTDLSVHTPQDLRHVADGLNNRPRKTLDWKNPREALNELLVATTA
jgi:IS30 family transposase